MELNSIKQNIEINIDGKEEILEMFFIKKRYTTPLEFYLPEGLRYSKEETNINLTIWDIIDWGRNFKNKEILQCARKYILDLNDKRAINILKKYDYVDAFYLSQIQNEINKLPLLNGNFSNFTKHLLACEKLTHTIENWENIKNYLQKCNIYKPADGKILCTNNIKNLFFHNEILQQDIEFKGCSKMNFVELKKINITTTDPIYVLQLYNNVIEYYLD